jgi:tetratricopeptide (TPR) repeat protein
MPEEPTLLVEGWLQFGRGELQCSAGEFGEAIDHLEAAAEAWFEDGRFDLWVLATRNLALAQCTLGDLLRAQELLVACEQRAASVSATSAARAALELQMFVAAELGDVKGAEDAYKHLGGGQVTLNDRVEERMSAFAHIALALAEGTSEEPEDWYEKLKKPLRHLPKYAREWTWSCPLYWATCACYQLVRMSKQSGNKVLTGKIMTSMDDVTKKLQGLAKRHKGVVPVSAFCDGMMDVAAGRTAKACDVKKGGFHVATTSCLETGSVLVAARAKVELARLSHEPASVKISSALSALEVFQSSESYMDTVACLLLLAQLDPTSSEFREMARVSQRRKSSARGSKGNSQAVIADLEEMEDVPLAGRKDELTALIKAANALRTGSGGATRSSLVIEAAGGMGKSALLKSFTKDVRASMHGIKLYSSAASQFEVSAQLSERKKKSWQQRYQQRTSIALSRPPSSSPPRYRPRSSSGGACSRECSRCTKRRSVRTAVALRRRRCPRRCCWRSSPI